METVDEVLFDESKFDIYIRMNGNLDHDYCFQVSNKTRFNDLIKIFTTLPVMLNQSIFYDRIPIGFKISTFPGQLTRTGGILFGIKGDFDEYLNSVNLSEKISDHVLPGQLIIPVFKHRSILNVSIITGLAIWLYTDLPDFISPTPGICLTNYVSIGICWLLTNILNKPDKGIKFYNDIMSPVGNIGQCIYFAFHIFKVLLLYFILWAGLFNPLSFFGSGGKKTEGIDKDSLIEIGWTGAKKVSSETYQNEFRKRIISKYGGILKAYTNGMFPIIKNSVIELSKGEGYDSKSEGGDFKLTVKLLNDQQKYFAKSLEGKEASEAFDQIRLFRQYGPFDSPNSIQKLLDIKFSARDLEIKNEQESKKSK